MATTIPFGNANAGFQAGIINGPVNVQFHSPSERLEELYADRDLAQLLGHLPPLPYRERHRDLQLRRMEGAGQWIIETTKFAAWRDGPKHLDNTIWCNGQPGAGKTYLASVIIDHLEALSSRNCSKVLSFYFDYKRQSEQTPFKILQTLLHQLLSTYTKVPASIRELQKKITTTQYVPNWNELKWAFISLCNESSDRVFIVIDALDECDESANRGPILELLEDLMASRVRLLITSRPFPPDIEDILGERTQILVAASESDIRAFVLQQIAKSIRMKKIIDNDIREKITTEIMKTSGGMFLLPALQVANVLSQTTRRQVIAALETIPTKLGDALDQTLDRINAQCSESDSRAKLALRVLMWLSTVRRPFTPAELQHAIAITTDFSNPQMDDLTDPAFFVDCCFGLVSMDSEKSVIRLVHLSINEYLQARKATLFPDADSILACSCLAYLQATSRLGSDFEDPGAMNHVLDRLVEEAPLLPYSCDEWGHHAAVGFDSNVDRSIQEFLSSGFPLEFWLRVLDARVAKHGRYSREEWRQEAAYLNRGISRLHIAAVYGIKHLAERCATNQAMETNPRDVLLTTPLMAAAGLGREEVFDLLLSRCCIGDVNATDAAGFTALVHAVRASHFELVPKLLNSPLAVDVNAGSPLAFAASRVTTESRKIVSLLLDHPHLDPNQRSQDEDDGASYPPWFNFAKEGYIEMLTSLLAKPELDPWRWGSPAQHLRDVCDYVLNSDYGHPENVPLGPESQCGMFAVVLLLDSDARFPMEQHVALKLLWAPVYYAYTDVVPEKFCIDWMPIWEIGDCPRKDFKQLFIDTGVSFNFVDSNGRGFLHYLAHNGRDEDIEFLLSRGINVDGAGSDGQTPLFPAVEQGHESTVRILLEAGANPSTNDNDGWTVLHSAACKGNRSIVEMLLERGARTNVANNLGETVLHAAASSEKGFDVIPLLLSHGFDLNATTMFGSSALEEAVRSEREPACKALLDSGALLTASPFSSHMLSIAVVTMNAGVNKLLLRYMDAKDEAVQTIYGMSVLDYLSQWPEETVTAMGYIHPNKMPTYKQTPRPVRRQRLLKHLLTRLQAVIDGGKAIQDVLLWRASFQLMLLGDDDAALIVLEQDADERTRGQGKKVRFNSYCDNCFTEEPHLGILLKCRTCPLVTLCGKCRDNRIWGGQNWVDNAPYCKNHEFMAYPREVWRTLAPGAVNEEGQNLQEFLVSLKERYEADYLATLSIESS